jgi:hypothetical protein
MKKITLKIVHLNGKFVLTSDKDNKVLEFDNTRQLRLHISGYDFYSIPTYQVVSDLICRGESHLFIWENA